MPNEQDNTSKEISTQSSDKKHGGFRARAAAWVRSTSLTGPDTSDAGSSFMSQTPPTSPGVMDSCGRRRCSLTKDNILLTNDNSAGEIQAFMDAA